MLGFAPLGEFALGQLPSDLNVALGDTITLTVTLDAGSATGQRQQQQSQHGGLGSGSGYGRRRRRRRAVARGAVLDLGIEIIPGRAHGTSVSQLPTDPDGYQQPEHGLAAGATLVITGAIIAGQARGDTVSYDNAFLLLSAA